MAQHHIQFYRLVGYLSLVVLTACAPLPPPSPAPMIIPQPDQQNGATRGHAIEKDTH
jgi:hypothetical protein